MNLCRRDRVKRRRAEAKKESKDDIVAASLSSSEQHKGPPDLAELSKGLPSGWQVSILDCSISDANIAVFNVIIYIQSEVASTAASKNLISIATDTKK